MFLEIFFRSYIFCEEKNENKEDNSALPFFLTDITIEKSNKNTKERKITLFVNEKNRKTKEEKKKNTMINRIKKH